MNMNEKNKIENCRIEPKLKLINMDSVEVEQVEWLLYPFIPYGKVTIIQGDPGEGKTTMVLQIIDLGFFFCLFNIHLFLLPIR